MSNCEDEKDNCVQNNPNVKDLIDQGQAPNNPGAAGNVPEDITDRVETDLTIDGLEDISNGQILGNPGVLVGGDASNGYAELNRPIVAETDDPVIDAKRDPLPRKPPKKTELTIDPALPTDETNAEDALYAQQLQTLADIDFELNNIYESVINGTGTVNPYTETVNQCYEQIDYLLGLGEVGISELSISQGGNTPLGVIQNLLTQLTALRDALGKFMSHVNQIVGLEFVGDLVLANVLRTMIESRRLSGFGDCSLLGGVFGAIAKVQDFLNKMNQFLFETQKFLQDVENEINDLIGLVLNLKDGLLFQIQQALANFAKAQLELLKDLTARLLADLFDDACFGEIFSGMAGPSIINATTKIRDYRLKL